MFQSSTLRVILFCRLDENGNIYVIPVVIQKVIYNLDTWNSPNIYKTIF